MPPGPSSTNLLNISFGVAYDFLARIGLKSIFFDKAEQLLRGSALLRSYLTQESSFSG